MPKNNQSTKQKKTIITAERRRLICEYINGKGSSNASELAELFGVTPATIRSDFNLLHEQGKLTRTHGGAIIRSDNSMIRPPYENTREESITQKQLIAKAALNYLPKVGSIFLSSGSTIFEFAKIITPRPQLQIITNSVPVTNLLIHKDIATVHLVGGTIRPESCSTDCAIPENVLAEFYWERLFIGAAAIDPIRGISTLEPNVARTDRKLMQHGGQVFVLCDSSKIGCYALAKIGPITLIDVLITDSGVPRKTIDAFLEQNIQVIIADEKKDDSLLLNDT